MNSIDTWVIYNKPTDYPNNYVARKFINNAPSTTIHVADSLEEIRKLVPEGLFKIERFPNDDPKIVEVWI